MPDVLGRLWRRCSRRRRGGAAGLPRGAEPAVLNPADFTTTIDNPWWPMRPGSRWVYRKVPTARGARAMVVVAAAEARHCQRRHGPRRARRCHGARRAVEVTDGLVRAGPGRERLVPRRGDGRVAGTGRPSQPRGSFEAGVDEAQAGVIMPARPRPGPSPHRQEYRAGEAEDRAVVLSLRERVEVPMGTSAAAGC